MARFIWFIVGACVLAFCLAACGKNTYESILDHPLVDQRIEETPREKVLRTCKQESDRFRVECTYCHTTKDPMKIKGPKEYQLTETGQRAHIMRHSPTFGLNNQCSKCHMSKFQLNDYAIRMFGEKGQYFRSLERAQEENSVR